LRREPLPHERHDLYNSPPPWHNNPPTWRNTYVDKRSQEEDEYEDHHRPIDQSVLSKRILYDCDDDDEYEGDCKGSYEKPSSNNKPHKPKPSAFRVPLPYPIFLESRDEDSSGEYSPFDYLPPLRPSAIKAPEKTWVKTWDKNKNGLPTIADSDEATVRIHSRPSNNNNRRRFKASKNKNAS